MTFLTKLPVYVRRVTFAVFFLLFMAMFVLMGALVLAGVVEMLRQVVGA